MADEKDKPESNQRAPERAAPVRKKTAKKKAAAKKTTKKKTTKKKATAKKTAAKKGITTKKVVGAPPMGAGAASQAGASKPAETPPASIAAVSPGSAGEEAPAAGAAAEAPPPPPQPEPPVRRFWPKALLWLLVIIAGFLYVRSVAIGEHPARDEPVVTRPVPAEGPTDAESKKTAVMTAVNEESGEAPSGVETSGSAPEVTALPATPETGVPTPARDEAAVPEEESPPEAKDARVMNPVSGATREEAAAPVQSRGEIRKDPGETRRPAMAGATVGETHEVGIETAEPMKSSSPPAKTPQIEPPTQVVEATPSESAEAPVAETAVVRSGPGVEQPGSEVPETVATEPAKKKTEVGKPAVVHPSPKPPEAAESTPAPRQETVYERRVRLMAEYEAMRKAMEEAQRKTWERMRQQPYGGYPGWGGWQPGEGR